MTTFAIENETNSITLHTSAKEADAIPRLRQLVVMPFSVPNARIADYPPGVAGKR